MHNISHCITQASSIYCHLIFDQVNRYQLFLNHRTCQLWAIALHGRYESDALETMPQSLNTHCPCAWFFMLCYHWGLSPTSPATKPSTSRPYWQHLPNLEVLLEPIVKPKPAPSCSPYSAKTYQIVKATCLHSNMQLSIPKWPCHIPIWLHLAIMIGSKSFLSTLKEAPNFCGPRLI